MTQPAPTNAPPATANAPTAAQLATAPSDYGVADNFDAPVVEAVRWPNDDGTPGTRDVSFARVDMDYLAAWAGNLRTKRRNENMTELNKKLGLQPVLYAQAQAAIYRLDVQIFEVMDQQYTPDGIKKILDDALLRAGMSNAAERALVRKRIGPMRQQQLAGELMSEPRATIEQLRDSVKKLAAKLGRLPGEVMNWTDAQLIEFASQYTPPPPPTSTLPGGAAGDGGVVADEAQADEGGEQLGAFANPTVPGGDKPGAASIGGPETL